MKKKTIPNKLKSGPKSHKKNIKSRRPAHNPVKALGRGALQSVAPPIENNGVALTKNLNSGAVVLGYVLPGVPHILLAADKNPGWKKLADAFKAVRRELEAAKIDGLLIYSTYWPSVIGHQIQADPRPKWVHVDEEFHELGSIPYEFKVDDKLSEQIKEKSIARGLKARTISYKGFPIDTGTVVVQKLLNADNRWPISVVSSNVYADRAETIVFGKAARDAVTESKKRYAAIVITSLSNRIHQSWIDPLKDQIHSLKDEEWNRKFLEFLAAGRLEDVAQLSRQFHREARVNKVANFKPFWWLSAVMGQNNLYKGNVFEYQPVFGSGAAVIGLTPSARAARDLEFDENDPDQYVGERNVLGPLL
jgi:2-aminophenol/2-amino-5-chlorophenol 1,6-dioxygenase subunit alpha